MKLVRPPDGGGGCGRFCCLPSTHAAAALVEAARVSVVRQYPQHGAAPPARGELFQRVGHQRPADAVNALSGEVWDLAYLGDMTVFHVKLDSGKIVKASAVNQARSSEETYSYHDRVWLTFRPDAGVVLEA